MPFRQETYRQGCLACPALTHLCCQVCGGSVCDDHLGEAMCVDCERAFKAASLGTANLAFTPPDHDGSPAAIASWNAQSDNFYRARFLSARLRRARSAKVRLVKQSLTPQGPQHPWSKK